MTFCLWLWEDQMVHPATTSLSSSFSNRRLSYVFILILYSRLEVQLKQGTDPGAGAKVPTNAALPRAAPGGYALLPLVDR